MADAAVFSPSYSGEFRELYAIVIAGSLYIYLKWPWPRERLWPRIRLRSSQIYYGGYRGYAGYSAPYGGDYGAPYAAPLGIPSSAPGPYGAHLPYNVPQAPATAR